MIAAWSRSLPRKRKISLRTDAASSREDATQEVNTGAGFLNCGLKNCGFFCKAVLKFICFFLWRFWTQPLGWLPHMDYMIFTRDHIYWCFTEGYHLNKPQALMRLSSCTAWSSCVLLVGRVSGTVPMTDACSTVQCVGWFYDVAELTNACQVQLLPITQIWQLGHHSGCN